MTYANVELRTRSLHYDPFWELGIGSLGYDMETESLANSSLFISKPFNLLFLFFPKKVPNQSEHDISWTIAEKDWKCVPCVQQQHNCSMDLLTFQERKRLWALYEQRKEVGRKATIRQNEKKYTEECEYKLDEKWLTDVSKLTGAGQNVFFPRSNLPSMQAAHF